MGAHCFHWAVSASCQNRAVSGQTAVEKRTATDSLADSVHTAQKQEVGWRLKDWFLDNHCTRTTSTNNIFKQKPPLQTTATATNKNSCCYCYKQQPQLQNKSHRYKRQLMLHTKTIEINVSYCSKQLPPWTTTAINSRHYKHQPQFTDKSHRCKWQLPLQTETITRNNSNCS